MKDRQIFIAKWKIKLNSTWAIITALLVLSLIVSACSSESATEAPPPPTQEIATEAPPMTTSEPALGPEGPVAVAPTPAPGTPSATMSVNTAVRSGPGTSYPVYGYALGGRATQLIGVSEDGQWWVISIPVVSQGQGWVTAANVTAAGAENVPVVPTPPLPPVIDIDNPGPDDPQATAKDAVYVRGGPGTDYPAYGIAAAGDNGFVLGVSEDGNWWAVRISPTLVGAGYGWVAKDWVETKNTDSVPVIQAPVTPPVVAPPPPAEGVPSATAIEYINIRSGPGTNYEVLGVAAPGASAEVIGTSADGKWWQVKVPATLSITETAWVSADWVIAANTAGVPVVEAPPPPPDVPVPAPDPNGPIATALEPINVRSGPSTQYPSYGIAAIGAQGEVIGVSSDGSWWVVKLPTTVAPDGQGWVNASYVTVANVDNVPVIEAPPLP